MSVIDPRRKERGSTVSTKAVGVSVVSESWLGFVAVVVAVGFGSAAAVGHVAPASSPVAGLVLEEPVVVVGGDEVSSGELPIWVSALALRASRRSYSMGVAS